MKIEVQKLDKLKRKIKIHVKGEEFSSEKKNIYKQAVKNLKVPGFRPGSAPIDVIEKHHGNFLRDEFLQKSLPLFYQKALEENNIQPASMPQISDIDLKSDSLEFLAELEVKPELDIKDSVYKGIKIKNEKCDVAEIEIEKILTNLKEGLKKVINKDLTDGELAKWSSYSDVKHFKEVVKGQIFFEKLRKRRQKIDAQIKTHLLKDVKVDLPKDEVNRQLTALVNRETYNLQNRGVPASDIEKYKKELEEKMKPQAADDVKIYYILDAIAKKEGIKIDNSLADIIFGFILNQAEYK